MPAGLSEGHLPRPFVSATAWRRAAGMMALLLVLALSSVQAQAVRVGGRAGPTFGFLNDSAVPFVSAGGDAAAHTNVRLDLHAGAFVVVPVGGRFALQPELLFVQKGGHFSRSTLNSYASERYRLSYVQGQLLGRRAISLPGVLSLHVVGGATVSRATGGAVQRDVHAREFTFKQRISLLEAGLIQQWDVGVLVGIGLSYPIGAEGHVSINVRYNPGFRAVFSTTERPLKAQTAGAEDPPPLTRTPPTLRHDVLTASLSYTMPLWDQ